jgi:hypothetical protein
MGVCDGMCSVLLPLLSRSYTIRDVSQIATLSIGYVYYVHTLNQSHHKCRVFRWN